MSNNSTTSSMMLPEWSSLWTIEANLALSLFYILSMVLGFLHHSSLFAQNVEFLANEKRLLRFDLLQHLYCHLDVVELEI